MLQHRKGFRMIGWIRSCLAGFLSSELRASKGRYSSKCKECKALIDKIGRTERERDACEDREKVLVKRVAVLEVNIAQLNESVESRDNQITLTDQVVEQQQYMIHRDLELRKLELLNAQLQVATIGGVSNQTRNKEVSHADDEPGINYRPGR